MIRTFALCLPYNVACFYPAFFCRLGLCQHYAVPILGSAANCNSFAAQFRRNNRFNRSVKIIQITMKYCPFHKITEKIIVPSL